MNISTANLTVGMAESWRSKGYSVVVDADNETATVKMDGKKKTSETKPVEKVRWLF